MVPTFTCGLVRANFSLATGGLFIISLSVDRSFRKPFVNNSGAHNRNRTDDLFLTKEVLYRLSYMGIGTREKRKAKRKKFRFPFFSLCSLLFPLRSEEHTS